MASTVRRLFIRLAPRYERYYLFFFINFRFRHTLIHLIYRFRIFSILLPFLGKHGTLSNAKNSSYSLAVCSLELTGKSIFHFIDIFPRIFGFYVTTSTQIFTEMFLFRCRVSLVQNCKLFRRLRENKSRQFSNLVLIPINCCH